MEERTKKENKGLRKKGGKKKKQKNGKKKRGKGNTPSRNLIVFLLCSVFP